jgi:ubiquinone/menaquinone biosynthesis C-methylase UbiE
MCADYSQWDQTYRKYSLNELGWELGKPRPLLVEFVEKGVIMASGAALDLCCGAGTNTIYLATSGFDVVGIDISPTALGIARIKAAQANVCINFLNESFNDLSFVNGAFDFVFDMGCFHHVEIEDRERFINGVYRVLKEEGLYMLTCFSSKNGPSWNHFTRQQLIDLFSGRFDFELLQHYASLEGDGIVRFFFTALLRTKVPI